MKWHRIPSGQWINLGLIHSIRVAENSVHLDVLGGGTLVLETDNPEALARELVGEPEPRKKVIRK